MKKIFRGIISKGILISIISIFISAVIVIIFMSCANRYLIYVIENVEDVNYFKLFAKYNFITVIIFIGAIVMFIFTFIFFSKNRINYLKYIIKSILNINGEKFLKDIKVIGDDEFSDLAKSINKMSFELRENFYKEKINEQSKYDLITAISHDLKTPITSIIGYLEILKLNKFEEQIERSKCIEISYNKSIILKNLLDELFEYTTLTNNQFKINKAKTNISILLNQIVGESSINFNEKNIDLILDNENKDIYLDIDSMQILKVFENLIDNAQKYSDLNSIFTIKLYEKENNVIILFKNKCESIEKRDLKNIFDKFYKKDKSRAKSGAGLGLAIAKQIIELHDGEIVAKKNEQYIEFKIIFKK